MFRRRAFVGSLSAAAVLAASGLPARASARRGGRLRAALGGASPRDSWDARTHTGLFMSAAGQGTVFDTLTEIAADGSLRGELATRWEASADARRWAVSLRRDVRFHNGQPFGPQDVIATYRMHMRGPSPAQPLLAGIADIRASGPHDLMIDLHRGNADFPYLLADHHLVIYPADSLQDAMVRGIGTGLYKVETFVPGVRLRARRVREHYKDGQAGWFEEVDFLALNDPDARMRAFLKGQVDAIDSPPQALGFRDGVRLVPGNRHLGFAVPGLPDALRRAMQIGMNRAQQAAALLPDGDGRLGNDTPFGPHNPYFDVAPAPPVYDPDRARRLVDSAGLRGTTIDMAASEADFQGAVAAAHLLAGDMAQLGVRIDIRETGAAAMRSTGGLATRACDGRATEDWTLAALPPALWPQAPAFAALVDQARAELDAARRTALYAEVQNALQASGRVVAPVYAPHRMALSQRLSTANLLGGLRAMDSARMAERWWLA